MTCSEYVGAELNSTEVAVEMIAAGEVVSGSVVAIPVDVSAPAPMAVGAKVDNGAATNEVAMEDADEEGYCISTVVAAAEDVSEPESRVIDVLVSAEVAVDSE